MRRIALIVFTFVLTGCVGTPMEWVRPNTSMAELSSDMRECQNLARDQAFRESFMLYPSYGMFGPWGRDRRYRHDPFIGSSYMDRQMRESSLQNFCLRSRGYQLQPVRPQFN